MYVSYFADPSTKLFMSAVHPRAHQLNSTCYRCYLVHADVLLVNFLVVFALVLVLVQCTCTVPVSYLLWLAVTGVYLSLNTICHLYASEWYSWWHCVASLCAWRCLLCSAAVFWFVSVCALAVCYHMQQFFHQSTALYSFRCTVFVRVRCICTVFVCTRRLQLQAFVLRMYSILLKQYFASFCQLLI